MIKEKQITVKAIACDVCEKLYEYSDEYSPWAEDAEWFGQFPEGGWEQNEEQTEHYCEDHWQWSDDDKEIIRKDK